VNGGPTPADPVVAREALGRLLSKEEQISDLIAFLAALDPQPLRGALGLTCQDPRVSREERLGSSVGLADIIVKDGDRPLALVEIKAAAGQHGDQFGRYDSWARAQRPEVRCYLVSLDTEEQDKPPGWTRLTLPALLRFWQASQQPHAGWLATSAAAVLERWMAEVDGSIGRATSPVVADLIARRVAADLTRISWLSHLGLVAEASRTSGGTATVLGWLPFPSEPQDPGAWLCADLRSTDRAHPEHPWLLRLGVEVVVDALRTAGQARAAAHDLAVPLRTALTCAQLQQALRRAGHEDVAATIRPWPRTYDGLRGNPDDLTLSAWRTHALTNQKHGRHPALFHDWGRRLASQIEVNVAELNRHQLLRLLATALDHLNRRALQRP
jgi:hypothetical protein